MTTRRLLGPSLGELGTEASLKKGDQMALLWEAHRVGTEFSALLWSSPGQMAPSAQNQCQEGLW